MIVPACLMAVLRPIARIAAQIRDLAERPRDP